VEELAESAAVDVFDATRFLGRGILSKPIAPSAENSWGGRSRLLFPDHRFRSQTRKLRGIARGQANHPIGIVLLTRLAVDRTQHGKGLGKALLFDALKRIEQAAGIVGVRAVMVHAIDETARRFYEHFEFEPSPVDPFQLLLLLKDLRRAIRAD
jgi:GNAT superfamily N-acetyltransferase